MERNRPIGRSKANKGFSLINALDCLNLSHVGLIFVYVL